MATSSSTLKAAFDEICEWLRPADSKTFMAGIARLILHAATYRIEVDDKGLERSYREACGDIPGDLWAIAVRRTLAKWIDTYRLPPPAIIRAEIEDELAARVSDMQRVRMAINFNIERPKLTFDSSPTIDPAELDRVVQQTRENLQKIDMQFRGERPQPKATVLTSDQNAAAIAEALEALRRNGIREMGGEETQEKSVENSGSAWQDWHSGRQT